MSWLVAFAPCAWGGGRLPMEGVERCVGRWERAARRL
ncbi:uncharacterized protein SOCE836_074450 [Sorangium cellulosum]|uniref:Uncharacterized protein n=1 Tax=Sorangium cellulosum TaxID=56 RepID=A0A4P2QXQ3_SORCE|nr:uncharacterized protein SOCE836_074450 [Sorangium cellulosum]